MITYIEEKLSFLSGTLVKSKDGNLEYTKLYPDSMSIEDMFKDCEINAAIAFRKRKEKLQEV